MDAVTPSEGWGVLHLYHRLDAARAEADPGSAKYVVEAVNRLVEADHQVQCFTVLGTKADVGFMALGPDLARLQAFQADLRRAPFEPAYSFVSLTELSEYTSTDDDERARLAADEGLTGDDLEEKLGEWRARMAAYAEHRLRPRLPEKRLLCFYPMSKRREPDANWYELPFDERKRLMSGHARVGRQYAGRILQLVTGSTGLDDWEWGVTLLADDPVALKDIVSEMRFDPVSARYADFGPFFVGLVGAPADVLRSVGLSP